MTVDINLWRTLILLDEKMDRVLQSLEKPEGGVEQADLIMVWQADAGADVYDEIDWNLVVRILRNQ